MSAHAWEGLCMQNIARVRHPFILAMHMELVCTFLPQLDCTIHNLFINRIKFLRDVRCDPQFLVHKSYKISVKYDPQYVNRKSNKFSAKLVDCKSYKKHYSRF